MATTAAKMARQVRMESRTARRARKHPGYNRGGTGVTFEQYWDFIQKDRAEEAERRKEREAEHEKRMKEYEADAAKRKKEYEEAEAKRKAEEAKRREEAEKAEAKRKAEEAKRREEDAQRKAEDKRRWEEAEKRSKELDKRMGDLTNTFGEIAEHLVAPGIAERFNEMGFHFEAIAAGGMKILDEHCKVKTEIDLILENGEYIIAVEVKTKPKVQHIGHHEKRLEILREYRSKKNDHRKIQGAMAGAIYDNDVKQAAIEAGMYVIEQSGDTMKIEVPEGFVPREW